VSYTLWEEIFAEFNFADFCPTREIKFRENSLKKGQNGREMGVRGSKWAKFLSENCSSAFP